MNIEEKIAELKFNVDLAVYQNEQVRKLLLEIKTLLEREDSCGQRRDEIMKGS